MGNQCINEWIKNNFSTKIRQISKAIFEFLPSLISLDIQSDNEFGVINIDIPSV